MNDSRASDDVVDDDNSWDITINTTKVLMGLSSLGIVIDYGIDTLRDWNRGSVDLPAAPLPLARLPE